MAVDREGHLHCLMLHYSHSVDTEKPFLSRQNREKSALMPVMGGGAGCVHSMQNCAVD